MDPTRMHPGKIVKQMKPKGKKREIKGPGFIPNMTAATYLYMLVPYAIPNTACHLVSIALTILQQKQKSNVARELIRRKLKRSRNHFSCKKPSLHQNQERKQVDR